MEKLCPILMHAMPQYTDNCGCKKARCVWWSPEDERCDPTGLSHNVARIAYTILDIMQVVQAKQ
jgi:hypothetical protein